MARPNYRKRKGNDTWHFCINCTQWPNANLISRKTNPNDGELCNQCKAKEKEKAKDCR